MLQGKKGLSDIVTNVLIILLVLVAVGIVWFFVQPFIRDSVSGISVDPYTVSLGVRANSVTVGNGVVGVVVERGAGKGKVVGFNIILTDSSGVNKVVRNGTQLGEFETVKVSIDYATLGLSSVKSVSVVPILVDGSGKEINGQQSSPVAPLGALAQICTPNSVDTTCQILTGSYPAPGSRTCNVAGTAWSPCACTDGNNQTCTPIGGGPGESTCTNGVWGSCTSTGVCTNGNTQSCSIGGFNGTQTCVAGAWNTCSCTNGQSISCVNGAGYAGTQTCSAGVIGSCTSTLSCGDGIINGPETCDYKSGTGFYGASCDYYGDSSNAGNFGCTNTCQTDSTCACYVDFDGNFFVNGDDDDAWNFAYYSSDMSADCNHDGVLNLTDGNNVLGNGCYFDLRFLGTCNHA